MPEEAESLEDQVSERRILVTVWGRKVSVCASKHHVAWDHKLAELALTRGERESNN